jgi:hypothetical protein
VADQRPTAGRRRAQSPPRSDGRPRAQAPPDPPPATDLPLGLILVDEQADAWTLATVVGEAFAVATFDTVVTAYEDELPELVNVRDILAVVPGDAGPAVLARATAAIDSARPLAQSCRLVVREAWPSDCRLALPPALDTAGSVWAALSNLPEWVDPARNGHAAPRSDAAGDGPRKCETGPRRRSRDKRSRDGQGDDGDERETQAQTLLRLAAGAELTRTDDHRSYAHIPVDSHIETYEIKSQGFRRWLTRQYYGERQGPPSSEAMQGALGVLEARAQFEGAVVPVHVRVAPGPQGAVVIDLGDDSWRAVCVGPGGWDLIDRPPVRFRRPSGLRRLPTPERGGSIRDLFQYANVDEQDRPLVVAWVTSALLPVGPYPVLALSGEHGAAKSTLARLLRRLVDPHASLLRSEPKEPRDLMISATNGWVVAIDNISALTPWMSDGLCRLATGGGLSTRQLYTDAEEIFLDAQRPVILTGIEDYAQRQDLADRCVSLHLPAIPEAARRTEAAFWTAYDADQARLLGALLDAVAGGLRLRPEVTLRTLPRMADFAVWGEAVCRATGWKSNDFLDRYADIRRDATEAALEDSQVAVAVRGYMAGRDRWEGTARELLEALPAPPADRPAAKYWPRSPRGLAGQLRRLAPALRAAGLDVAFGREHDRRLTIARVKEGGQQAQQAQPPQQPETSHPAAPVGDFEPTHAHPPTGAAGGCAGRPPGRAGTDGQPAHRLSQRNSLANKDLPDHRDGCDGCVGQSPYLTGDREVGDI